jgi:CheY-like chemotaxis protein
MGEPAGTKLGGSNWRERFAGVKQAFLGLCGLLPADAELPADVTVPLVGDLPRYSVLMIDADRDFLSVTGRHLAEAGFNVLSAETVASALAQLGNLPNGVEVVLLDYDLTNTTGAEALRHLRQLRPKPGIIGLTRQPLANVSADFRERADMMFSKPLDSAALCQNVHKLIADNLGLSKSVP